jgi:hypothetical protein
MNFKQKLLATSVLACFMATPAFADDSIVDIIEELEEFLDYGMDMDDRLVAVVSGAFNLTRIDASVNFNAEAIELNSSSVTAVATATADSNIDGAEGNVSAIANAVSGNIINTTAIGAFNDTNVAISNVVQGEDSVDEDYGVGLFQTAFNVGDIDATVNLTAAPTYERDSFWDRNRDLVQNTISVSNISISTTAIGAYNAGDIAISNAAVQEATFNFNFDPNF